MHDTPEHACGVFGVYAPGIDVARFVFFGLYALQHRGQESAGIATTAGSHIEIRRGMGLVAQVFDEDDLRHLTGPFGIGHVRYSTTGSSRIENAQPLIVQSSLGPLALAHNGNVINAGYLREQLSADGIHFETSTDSEVLAQQIAASPGRNWQQKIRSAMNRVSGAYCLTLMTRDSIIGVRDPLGVHPLCLGRFQGGWVLASETCAFDHLGAQFIREVEPGEIVVIDKDGVHSYPDPAPGRMALCLFEYIYFARPDSVINGKLLYLARERMGERLAEEYPVEADLVVGTPESAVPAAIGYAKRAGIPYSQGLIKNRYVGRTFIQPDQRLRELGVQLKFNPLPEVLAGKRVVVVDDSIVRGTTTPHVVSLLRRAGAAEVHMRICAPPIAWPCFFGVDMATRGELIAAKKTVPEIREWVGADSLGYLSLDGLISATQVPGEKLCTACLTGLYPVPVQLEMDKLALEEGAPQGVRPAQALHSSLRPLPQAAPSVGLP
ncbi:MAG: amidophosphoribosyltransferase [Chloroflexi bacterium]|nr:amidophosphoribosyltransferase [Chloroflexota bacterium]